MKKLRILQMVIAGVLLVSLASCYSGRYYSSYPPPPPHASVSLILNAGPGIIVSRYPDGRYYYRSPEGYMYWRGYDNRYYLDRRYMSRGYYGHPQYNEWRRHYRR